MMFFPLSPEAWSHIASGASDYHRSECNGGPHYVVTYPNGFGASIIKSEISDGHEDNLWELAKLDHGSLCQYDIYGELTEEQVVSLCDDIALFGECLPGF